MGSDVRVFARVTRQVCPHSILSPPDTHVQSVRITPNSSNHRGFDRGERVCCSTTCGLAGDAGCVAASACAASDGLVNLRGNVNVEGNVLCCKDSVAIGSSLLTGNMLYIFISKLNRCMFWC